MATNTKPTVSKLRQMVDELLAIQAVAERYGELEKQIKADMLALKYKEMNIPGKGRVFISESERKTIPVRLATDVLGSSLANKIIQVKQSVSNTLLEAFVTAGEISPEVAEELNKGAEKQQIVNLYVRPLK